MPRIFSLALGALALLTTTATLCTQSAVSVRISHSSPGRTASTVAAVFEAAVLILLGWLIAADAVPSFPGQSKLWRRIVSGLEATACVIATGTSLAALVYLARADGGENKHLLVASSVTLGLAVSTQLVYTIYQILPTSSDVSGASWPGRKDEESGRSRKINLKAIRYSQTMPIVDEPSPMAKIHTRSRPTSVDNKSIAETVASSVTYVAQSIRSVSSRPKTRSSKEKERSRSMSIESTANRSTVADDAFDSWDTSTVDAHCREAVLEVSTPTQSKPRGLETIPASPVPSRSPSPASFAELEPPRIQTRRRSRSYSPVSIRRELRDLPTPGSSGSEAHIHPLFRSDSPDPHPFATPGTIVMAAPETARVLVHRSSNLSLNRLRSDSMPNSPNGFSRHDFDSRSLRGNRSELDLSEQAFADRGMAPPAPEWLRREL
ncbi:hypothetical protein BBK36DRAFT_1134964 [Trichoderma citrinoviride]|uniref:MARVEL domain-containing protein n=1 Tax=Trichoderma citrinoviride TaxID=58853 RepID=A0A2T4BDP7_9HYPO|nr:hypothetical protein BBK36DRAFT_1134964 [Trichoderma citrinoviride]PTB67309.1 hypothetical protein BBK36DRAFT_1134964 [Trichoderma citrinoviride]